MAENDSNLEATQQKIVGDFFGVAAERYKTAFSQLDLKLKGFVAAGLKAIAHEPNVTPDAW